MVKSKKYNVDVLVPDTSVIINGIVSEYIKKGLLKAKKIIINEAVLSELEYQANSRRITGEIGLEEIKKLRKLCKVEFLGRKPLPHEIKNAKKGGEIDSLIRQTAFEEKGVLITADKVQSMVAEAKGIKCIFIEKTKNLKKMEFLKLFDKNTYKIYLKEGEPVTYIKINNGKLNVEKKGKKTEKDYIEKLTEQISEEISKRDDGFIEVNKKGFLVLRIKDFRIMITSKPVANKTEAIIIKKPKSKTIYDYKINIKYLKEIENADVLFIMGNSIGEDTLCEGLLNYFEDNGKNVCAFLNDFNVILEDKIMQYKRDVDSIDIIRDSSKDYVYMGNLIGEDDGLLLKWFNDNKIKSIVCVKEQKIANCVEKIINLSGLKVIEKGIIIKVENSNIKNIFRIDEKGVLDLLKDKIVLRIEND